MKSELFYDRLDLERLTVEDLYQLILTKSLNSFT